MKNIIMILLGLTVGSFASTHEWNETAIEGLVFVHNKLRNDASQGLWARHNISKSTDMQKLFWNNSLVAEAKHEMYDCDQLEKRELTLGENIYQYDVTTYDDVDGQQGEAAINKDSHDALSSKDQAAQYRLRQILYSKSNSIGCIYESCDRIDDEGTNYNTRFIICKYSPALKNIDDQLYEEGEEACSNCPSGTSCTDPMMKLCEKKLV
ncbi:SCP domain-containing protein [Caenorhabditis elegans]|uniref:SCP domain-containing protein n=1 Tax=Caenorhabditis elegans TaxID=6239 RepID=Q22930_CAEEL|nr:SCP domain-containing protein [Caenorhabditis elegans]CCD67747.1 SCP domain-containing protein [Caenorhabditis elegans]|eukprot:NP_504963.1 SCP-Like extracellular protein [Caenorhabditis elegans]